MENILARSLVDTNILVYANNEDSPYYNVSKKLVENLLNGEDEVVLAIQNLVELYAIITDKKRVEHPLSPEKAKKLLDFYIKNNSLKIIFPTSQTPHTIAKLIDQYKPRGQRIFDYMLSATMLDNGVSQIYTSDDRHFKTFKFLKVTNPLSSF